MSAIAKTRRQLTRVSKLTCLQFACEQSQRCSLVKKSWFGSLTNSNSVEREDVHLVPVQGRSLNAIKAELIRAFLTVTTFCIQFK